MAVTDDTRLLTIGPVHTLTQNVTYVAPVRLCRCYVQAGAAMEQSNDNTTWDAVTLDDDEGFDVASSFIRTTAATALVRFAAR